MKRDHSRIRTVAELINKKKCSNLMAFFPKIKRLGLRLTIV